MVDVVGDSIEEADEGKTETVKYGVTSKIKTPSRVSVYCLRGTSFTVAPRNQSAATDLL